MKPGALRTQLADLAVLQARTDADERKILAAALKRHDEVQAALEQARAAAEADDAAADRYQALVLEYGQLNIVIAKARAALGE